LKRAHYAKELRWEGFAMAITAFSSDGPFSYTSIVRQSSGAPVITDISAEDYLTFAKGDLSAGTRQGAVNAMGNAKRSLHLMIDTLLQNFGLLAHNQRLSFPGKLALMDDVGLISLNVFRKLNVERNMMEHDYRSPDPERVQDFVDVCNLLLLAIERLGQDITYKLFVGVRDSGEHRYLVLEPTIGRLDFFALDSPLVSRTKVSGIDFEYVSTAARTDEGERVVQSIGELAESIELRSNNKADWIPMLKTLVELSNSQSRGRATTVHDGTAFMTVSTTISMTEDELQSFSDFMENGRLPGGVRMADD
jgi:hypothetical protein